MIDKERKGAKEEIIKIEKKRCNKITAETNTHTRITEGDEDDCRCETFLLLKQPNQTDIFFT